MMKIDDRINEVPRIHDAENPPHSRQLKRVTRWVCRVFYLQGGLARRPPRPEPLLLSSLDTKLQRAKLIIT